MNLQALLRNYTIRTRMWGAIAMVLVLLLAMGGLGLLSTSRVVAAADATVQHQQRVAATLGGLRSALGDLRRYEKDMVIHHDAPNDAKGYRAKWDKALADARAHVRTLSGDGQAALPELTAKLRRVDDHLADYARLASPVLEKLEQSGVQSASMANQALGAAKDPIRAVDKAMGELQAAVDAQAARRLDEAHATERQAYVALAVAMVLSLALVVPLTLLNMVSICRPIDEAEALARAIAQGDLGTEVRNEGRDEAARLTAALEAMRQWLAGIVGEVRQSADSIRTSSAEVAAGNQGLLQRTEQAGASLQQTAGSVEQLAEHVQQNAQAATQANDLASTASDTARRGGQAVAQVVGSMEEISSASRKIADITGVIDSIAFQTNILALNAAVEAARAGEQGRGFAVVASEVRSLAQRSANAAREIKGLIGASVDKVESGATLARDAGTTMDAIVSGVQRVSDLIGDISAAAAEQSGGITQVNQTVGQLDQATQQNAALVEQSAAAAESLTQQAERLAGLVATFRIAQQHHAGAMAPI